MKIRMSLLAAASAVALVAGLAAPAGAATPPINVSGDHITCNSVVGALKFNPPLIGGGATTTAIGVKATLSGCTDTDNNTLTVVSGTMAGPLAGGSNDCSTLLGLSSAAGAIVLKWKTLSGSPKITPTASTLNITQMNGTTFGPVGGWGGSYGEFQMGTAFGTATPNVTAGGAFRGGDNGHSSTLDSSTGQDVGSLGISCLVGGGIKQANFGIGSVTIG